ncbi:MAG: esterase-like activity of phytase family protein [Cyanobacteria bacterium J06638_20]
MKQFSSRSLRLIPSFLSVLVVGSLSTVQARTNSFVLLNRYVVGGAVAEIISATPDGNTLVFTNAGDAEIGFVDISDPEAPTALGTVEVPGEPTSVVVTPNGVYAIAAVLDEIDEEAGETLADQQPGVLVFIRLDDQEVVAELPLLGIGPDSIDVSPDGSKLVVAIEDEEDEDSLPGDRPGSINFVTIDYEALANSVVTAVPLDLSGVDGVNYPTDPQPEFVKFSPDGSLVAVTIQENNAIALLDTETETVLRIFSAGTATSDTVDLIEDGEISLTQSFEGRREPDAIAFTPDGNFLITANEGDTDLERFGDGVWSGGRGWTVFNLEGDVIYDASGSVGLLAAQRGQYPEGRSENRGVEMEGTAVGLYGNRPIAFIGSERGSFIVAYDLRNPESPRLMSFLPTGVGPEGILPIPSRNLLLASNEEDGTIDFFQLSDRGARTTTSTAPQIISRSPEIPFSALSGAYQVPGNPRSLVVVPDNAIAPSRIFTLTIQNDIAVVDNALMLMKDGEPVGYDLEGITIDADGNYWLVSEGDNREGRERPNLLIQANAAGEVLREIELPAAEAAAISRFGFEGVTTSVDGDRLYIAIQREFEGDPANQVRIAEYVIDEDTWNFYFYPLDTDNAEGWVGLSEIARDRDGSFLVIERDNQGSANGAANARIKRIYRFSLDGVAPDELVEKTLVADLLTDYDWIEEKVESLAVTDAGYWVISDNDGGEQYSRMLFIPR